MKNVLITGGAGFISSNFVRYLLNNEPDVHIINLDALTYAGSLENLKELPDPDRHVFVEGDICDRELVDGLLRQYKIDTVAHFAAESHVDRSILGPEQFIQTNVIGTFTLLEAVRHFWIEVAEISLERARFHHVSTDEVYGSLKPDDPPFSETTPYAFPEKLIPLMILNVVEGKLLPIYGDGKQIRDWLYVKDHCEAIWMILRAGKPGETYNIGGANQPNNLEIVRQICKNLDACLPASPHKPHEKLIQHVAERPGHDRRYAMDIAKIRQELGWQPKESLESGLQRTIKWYLNHGEWISAIKEQKNFDQWIEENYGNREKES